MASSYENSRRAGEYAVASFEAASRLVLGYLTSNNYKIGQVYFVNNNRYSIITGAPENILVTYKREPFYNFGKMFAKKGVGDTINLEELREALKRNVTRVYTVYAITGKVYTISLQKFLDKSIRWENKEGKLVRSVSIHEYELAFQV